MRVIRDQNSFSPSASCPQISWICNIWRQSRLKGVTISQFQGDLKEVQLRERSQFETRKASKLVDDTVSDIDMIFFFSNSNNSIDVNYRIEKIIPMSETASIPQFPRTRTRTRTRKASELVD